MGGNVESYFDDLREQEALERAEPGRRERLRKEAEAKEKRIKTEERE